MTSPLSSVHRGVAFEQRALRVLQSHLSMSLKRVGGKSDGGIDLLGWWWLPNRERPAIQAGGDPLSPRDVPISLRRFRVFGQCKAEKKKMGPNYVREMEGVLHRLLLSRTQPGVHRLQEPSLPPVLEGGEDATGNSGTSAAVALLVSESPFSRSTLLRAHSSPVPFLLLHLPSFDSLTSTGPRLHESADALGSAFWNPALGSSQGLLGGDVELRWERQPGSIGRPGLWMNGRRITSCIPSTETGQDGSPNANTQS